MINTQKLSFNFRRITPFILVLSYFFCNVALAHINEVVGQWTFIEDGAVIDIAPCPAQKESLCATIVWFPSKDKLTPSERDFLCRTYLLGDLRFQSTDDSGKPIYHGWIIDPEDLLKEKSPTHYEATLTVISPMRAVIEVRVVGDLYSERHDLVRNVVPVRPCRGK